MPTQCFLDNRDRDRSNSHRVIQTDLQVQPVFRKQLRRVPLPPA